MATFSRVLMMMAFLASGFVLQAQKMEISDPTGNKGKVKWQPMQLEVGETAFSVPISGEFKVTNISQEDLLLKDVKTGCHCTLAEWDKQPIKPGQTTNIKITYDAMKDGEFYKVVFVSTNFDTEKSVVLSMVGKVLPKPAEEGQH